MRNEQQQKNIFLTEKNVFFSLLFTNRLIFLNTSCFIFVIRLFSLELSIEQFHQHNFNI
jgi:hypothetical protein